MRGERAHGGKAHRYLFNHKALAKVLRAKVLDAFERAGLVLPAKLPATWVVDCKSVGDGARRCCTWAATCTAA